MLNKNKWLANLQECVTARATAQGRNKIMLDMRHLLLYGMCTTRDLEVPAELLPSIDDAVTAAAGVVVSVRHHLGEWMKTVQKATMPADIETFCLYPLIGSLSVFQADDAIGRLIEMEIYDVRHTKRYEELGVVSDARDALIDMQDEILIVINDNIGLLCTVHQHPILDEWRDGLSDRVLHYTPWWLMGHLTREFFRRAGFLILMQPEEERLPLIEEAAKTLAQIKARPDYDRFFKEALNVPPVN